MKHSKPLNILKKINEMMAFLNEYFYIPEESQDEVRSAVALHCRLYAKWQDLLWPVRGIDEKTKDDAFDEAEEARLKMIETTERFPKQIKGENFFAELLKDGDDTLK